MREQAIALCRISSISQNSGHSLEAQEQSIRKMAEEMTIDIANIWSITQSSKAGTNKTRKDLLEIKNFCRSNRKVKYLLVDRVSRLMREWKMMLVYIFELEDLGVKVIFCDPTQRHLNSDDQLSQLLLIIEGFKTQEENKERAETTVARMKARYASGYYISRPHAGYMKTDVAGLHIPDPERFDILKNGGRLIIYKQYTLAQAVQWMNDSGYRTLGGKKLDVDHYVEFTVDRYYCGKIDIQSEGWPKDVNGLHLPMFSNREHKLLVACINKRNPRIRQKYNPDFAMSNILRHAECEGLGGYEKFVGTHRNPGKRPSGRQRQLQPVYDCRDCRKRLPRKKVHEAFTYYLDSLQFLPNENSFKKALLKVWRSQRGTVQHRLSSLQGKKMRVENDLKVSAANYNREPEGAARNALRLLMEDYDKELRRINEDLVTTQSIDFESVDFVRFALDFVGTFKDKWWELTPENKKRGEQILFNGKIYIDNSANVHPLKLSTIYRLGTNKKALSNVDNAHLVEHLEKSSPLIVEEVARWRDLLWDDYLDYQHRQKQLQKLDTPRVYTLPLVDNLQTNRDNLDLRPQA